MVHSTTGISHSRVTHSDVLAIWRTKEARTQGRVRVAKTTFRVGQHVRFNKEMMRFAKAAEHRDF